MIVPRPSDIGRTVKLPRVGAPPEIGTLIEVHNLFGMVRYGDNPFPVSTDLGKLEWAETEPGRLL